MSSLPPMRPHMPPRRAHELNGPLPSRKQLTGGRQWRDYKPRFKCGAV